jgi:asparagine synthase (glutamine-hydrolysing)
MSPFAGIVRHDSQPVPESWLRALAGCPTRSNRIRRTVYERAAAFVEYERGPIVSAAARTDVESATGSCCGPSAPLLLLDARIDNREALGAQCGFPGSVGSDVGDAAIVALAYERWGEGCVEQLLGEFVLARWDPVCRRLFLARDALGVRAVYYHASASLFAFATELRALLALPGVPRRLREESIADFLRGDGSGPAGTTFYDAIHVLPSAHKLALDGDRLTHTRYWVPAERPTCRLTRDEDYARELRERITAAVACRLRGGRTIAVHLSGGLDSSAVACLAARHLKRQGRRLLALCSMLPPGYTGPESDERVFVEAVLAQEDNIDAVWVEPSVDSDPFSASTRWFEALGQPAYSNVSHIEEMLGEAGRAHGVDVVLSGFGGDFFASWRGANVIREILRSGRWRLAMSELQALHREQGTSWRRLLKQEVLVPFLPSRVRAWRSAHAHGTCVHPDLARRVDQRRGRRSRPSAAILACGSPSEVMRFIVEPGHIEQPVSHSVQVFAQEFSQALRFPLLDVRVIEFMLSVPVEQLQKGGWPRSLMRRAMQGILPEVIRLRRDKGGAFDPAITSRLVTTRALLTEWAAAACDRTCWQYVDRARFLEALSAVERAPRPQWRPETFQIVVMGGCMARFVDWYERSQELACA